MWWKDLYCQYVSAEQKDGTVQTLLWVKNEADVYDEAYYSLIFDIFAEWLTVILKQIKKNTTEIFFFFFKMNVQTNKQSSIWIPLSVSCGALYAPYF